MNEDNVVTGIYALGCLGAAVMLLAKVVLPIAALIAIIVWLLK